MAHGGAFSYISGRLAQIFRWAELYSIPLPQMGSEINVTLIVVIDILIFKTIKQMSLVLGLWCVHLC